MKVSEFFIRTFREPPADAVVASHRWLVQAGFIRKQGAGHYHLLPLGLRSLRKIETIVRSEMEAAGAIEFQLPQMISSELWERSGRWQAMGKELFRLKDRHDHWNVMGPTHEESFTDLLCGVVKSYKELPLNIYQIQTKFRDEIRPRYGMIRSREFIMKDAYSFHANAKSLTETYERMRQAYRAIFTRLSLDTLAVEADSGSMGGARSEEFMIACDVGEETLLVGPDYRGNREKTAVLYGTGEPPAQKTQAGDRVHTPGIKTIDDLARFFGIQTSQILKGVAFLADGNPVVAFIRGDREVNEAKLKNHLAASELEAAPAEAILGWGSVPGFIGPGLAEGTSGAGVPETSRKNSASKKKKSKKADGSESREQPITFVYDRSLLYGGPYVVGANEVDFHIRDCMPILPECHDIALARAGDPAPEGTGELKEMKGMELGHIFQLGDKYSRSMGLEILDENGRTFFPLMGCYGIGINRTLAAIAEQHCDDKGLFWPVASAPFEILLISIARTETEMAQVEALYRSLLTAGLDVLWDDREERPGVKFNDADLIGYPFRITAGKTYFSDGNLEIRIRRSGEDLKCPEKEIVAFLNELRAKEVGK